MLELKMGSIGCLFFHNVHFPVSEQDNRHTDRSYFFGAEKLYHYIACGLMSCDDEKIIFKNLLFFVS